MDSIRHKHGKNSIMRGISYIKGATQRERNGKIGGHKA
ncbi:DNA polymerase IV [Bacillus mycoides]|nr:DNA polymerase IV [Bacillus mycoides]